MRLSLKRHPDSRCDAVTAIDVEIARRRGVLQFHYIVTGDIGSIVIPELLDTARADKLWQHTVFEAFIRTGPETYVEFNFSPSGQWAAYRFARYRGGVTNIAETAEPGIGSRQTDNRFDLAATLDLSRLPDLAIDQPWKMAITTVIEESGGNLSYWSLAHGPGKPDFHHSDGFVLDLPATE
jgi:hypothetical protein